MDLNYSPEDLQFRKKTRQWLEANVPKRELISLEDLAILLARTDGAVAKHKGISCFLFNMRQPGVEVRPLRQITGGSEFNEVFMTNARAEKVDLIGRLGQGWEIAQTTLGFERGGNALGRV